MTKDEVQELESIRKRIHKIIGDDVILHVRFSEITTWLHRLVHKKTFISHDDNIKEIQDKIRNIASKKF